MSSDFVFGTAGPEHVAIVLGRCGHCGELWPACTCGKPTPPGALDGMEPEPAAAFDWLEWWRGNARSLAHARQGSGLFFACGRRVPAATLSPAGSETKRCRVCLLKLGGSG